MYECKQCKDLKCISEFYTRKNRQGNKVILTYICKTCFKQNQKDNYQKNKIKISARIKTYKLKQREEKTEVYTRSLASNRARQKEYQKTLKGKLVNKRIQHLRRDLLSDFTDITTKSLQNLLNTQENKCYICKENLQHDTPRAVHLDHIIPLSKGGKHILSNVAWACSKCNLSKYNKV